MHFKKCLTLAMSGVLLASFAAKAQQPFGAGNIVVYRIGDGSTALSGIAAPVFIDEYTTTGTLVQSIAMPTAVSGSNYRLTESGSAASDGQLHLSPNGKYLAFTGYDAAVGTTGVASTASATTSRVVGIMNSQGAYSTSSAYNIISGANIRSAITTDSNNLWIAGGGSGGIYYATVGTSTALQISGAANNMRCVNIFNGQLYYSSSSSTYRVGTVGTGLPTTAAQTLTNLPGTPTSGSPYDFYIANLSNGNTVLYVVDDGIGILKYSLVSGSWVANGTIGSSSDKYSSITGVVGASDAVTLYATGNGTKLVTATDNTGYNTAISSANTTITTLVTPGTNKAFRGVAFAPQCPVPVITTQPTAQTVCTGSGATFAVVASGTGLTYQWMKGGNTITGATNATYTIPAATMTDTGNYTVVITACNSVTSNTAHLTVNNLPAATITPAGSAAICQGSSVTLNANTGTGLTYQWMNGAITLTGQTSSSYTASATGNYTVTVTNSSNCAATSAATAVTVNPLPAATITPATTTTFCSGGSVVLNANTGTGLTYQWKNGSTVLTGQTNSSYTATTAGNYTVTVANSSSCSATSTATTVTVNPLPAATITAAGSTNLCSGGSVVLNANTGTGLTYQWQNGSTVLAGQTNSSYTASAAGSYTVTVSNGTCSATSSATTVTVLGSTAATFTPSGTVAICQGDSALLTANTGTGLTYQWAQGAANIAGATNGTYKAYAAGSYTVIVSNGSCSSTSAATTITINALPASAITAGGNTTFCTGDSVTLNANTGTGLTYQWSQAATAITGATTASYNAHTSGSYTVKVTDGNGCAKTSAATAVVANPLPAAAITAATDTTFCQGGSVVLNANAGTGLTYRWKQNNANINGATSAAYTANISGDYTVVVTDANTCTDSSAVKMVTVNPLPVATVQVNGFTLSTGTYDTYQWYYNNQAISGATSQSTTATQNGAYYVMVADSNGCSANSDTVNITNVGVETIHGAAGVQVYPNPASDVLHVEAAVPVAITVRDMTGKIIISATAEKNIAINGQADGLYMISVTDLAGNVLYSGRFIKMTR